MGEKKNEWCKVGEKSKSVGNEADLVTHHELAH